MPTPSLVLYHRNCPSGDGFGAALAAWLVLGDEAEYLALDYGDEPPPAEGRDVYILDLSFPEPVMTRLGQQARSLTLLDHHLTAQRNLASFRPLCCHRLHFNLTKCGAVLAWEHFHPGRPVPLLFRFLQARDLWTWDEPFAEEFLAWLDIQPKTFARWAEIARMGQEQVEAVLPLGRVLRQQLVSLSQSMAARPTPITLAGVPGLMVNASGELRSEVGSLLAQKSGTFGMVWRVAEDGSVLVSLRSLKAGVQAQGEGTGAPESPSCNVETLARLFGGGGHVTSASFRLSSDRLPELTQGALSAAAQEP